MSVTAELVMEEGGFGMDLCFLEKRQPRIAIAGGRVSRESVEDAGANEKDYHLWDEKAVKACHRSLGWHVWALWGGSGAHLWKFISR